MKKNYNSASDARNESVELTKRLYRGITDVARRLDERRGRAQTCDDLFLPSLEAQRVKLREYCERLIFSDPVNYGQKGEDILWRKGYYDVVSTAKRMRKNNTWSSVEIAYLQSHLASGVGHYHHLISRLQIEFKVDLRGMIDFPILVSDEGLTKAKSASNKMLDAKTVEWATMAAHRCLVYLGDLNRYFLDIYPHWDTGLTARYYLQALNLNPDVGMPHNQLGSLSGTKNFNLDAAYYYMRCLMCPQPFEGAEGNLQRIFEKNSKWVENQSYENNFLNPSQSQEEHIHCLIARFLLLADIWFFDKTSVPDINELCWTTVEDFKNCLKYASPFPVDIDLKLEVEVDENVSGDKEDETPEYLKHEIIFKMVVVLLMCIGKLQSTNSLQHSAAVAFTLGFLSLLVDHLISHIQESVFTCSLTSFICDESTSISSQGSTVDSPVVNSPHLIPHTSDTVTEASPAKVEINGKRSKGNLKKSTRLRRRRRRPLNGSEDSDLSDGDSSVGERSCSDADSDISEIDEPLDSSSDAESGDELSAVAQIQSDKQIINGENHADEVNIEVKTHIDIKNNLLNDSVKSVKSVEKMERSNGVTPALPGPKVREPSSHLDQSNTLDPADLIELLTGDRVLDAIKILTDWLKGDPAVIKKCARTSRELFVKIISLLNLVNINADSLKKDIDGAHIFKLKDIGDVFARVPLPEDIILKKLCLDSFKHSHESLDWEYLRHHCVHAKEEALLRVYKLVSFGHFLVSTDIGVTFDSNKRLFTISSGKSKGSPAHKEGKVSNNSSTNEAKENTPKGNKGDLLKQMGQLWLRAEVKDLESRVGRRSNFSPYLAIDVEALIHHSRLVKQLVGARKFIILIPSIVVCALDELKRELGKARETIRWLECQFQKGNRFLRAQRSHERLPIPLIKYPKKKDKEAWLFFQIVECCHYFSQQSGMQARPDTAMVTLLTGHKNCTDIGSSDDTAKAFSPVGIAKSAGINFEFIEVFHSRWKSSNKSHG